ncbi:MAG: hypothetical protein EXS13_03355 [Planctomycetes bacterium]|nr:hypothetical protein [Planctomycetota bacterium]
MRLNSWSTLLCGLLAIAAVGSAQETPPAPAPAPAPAPTKPPAVKPPVRTNKAPTANVPVADVAKYRGELTAVVTRASSHFDLDLSGVDLAADPVVVVDGQPITQADLARQMAFSFGANEIEQFMTGVLLRRVKAEFAAAGKPVPPTAVTEEEIKAKFEEDKKVVPQMRGMTIEQYEKAILENIGWPRYVEFQRQQLEFERFFLPEPPEEWAKRQRELTKELDDEEKVKEEKRKEEEAAKVKTDAPAPDGTAKPADGAVADDKKPAQKLPAAPPADLSFIPDKTWELMDERTVPTLKLNYARGHGLHPLMRTGLIASFRKKLLATVEVRAGRADEPDVAIVCAGESFALSDLLALLGSRMEDAAKRAALRELVNLRAIDARLAREGKLLSEADAEARLQEWRKKYEGSLISSDQILSAYGYNSIWHYREVFRRKQSFRDLTLVNLTDDRLKQHYDLAGRVFFESGTCISQILFVPGPDKAASRAKVDALLAAVGTGERSFATVAREEGKYPDSADVHSGAIAPLVRNKLRSALQESEYMNFLTGHSFADETFYSAKEGAIIGPIWRDVVPERAGWYVLHVDRFFTSGSRPTLDDAKAKDRATDDLIDVTFPRFVNDALAACSIELPRKQ